MIIYFVLSLVLFSIIDIFYIYNILDSLFFYTNQGSKLKSYIKNSNTSFRSKYDEFIFIANQSFNLLRKNLFKFIFLCSSLFLVNISVVYNFLTSKFIIINFLGKQIDLVSTYGNTFEYIKVYYILSCLIFVIIFIFNILKVSLKEKILDNVDNVDSFNICLGDYDESVNKRKICSIKEKGLYQNILITGSIGSGKTSSAIYTILDQLINYNLGGLILDVKGNFVDILKEVLLKHNRIDDLKVISVSGEYLYNPIDNNSLNAGEIANRLKNVLALISEQNTSDTYWLDKATTVIECFIIISRSYSESINFEDIYKLTIDNLYLNNKLNELKENILKNKYKDEELFKLNYAITFIKNEYFNLDNRVLSIIKSEITRITNVFISDYEIYSSFCKSDKKNFRFNLNSKEIVLLSIDVSKYKYIAKIIATYIKQEFQSLVLNDMKRQVPIFFICDEYQEFANKDDANFLSLSREAKCINVMSMQSYTSLNNTLKDENATRIIIQNCINKIWFRNDDNYTINEIMKQIGKLEIDRETIGYSENAKMTNYNMLSRKFKNINSNICESYSISKIKDYKYDEKFFTQELKTFEALAFVSDGINVSLSGKVKLNRKGEVLNNEENNCD